MSRRHSGDEISRARLVQNLKALHAPYDVYEKCGHNHALNDPNAQDLPPLGMVCADGIVATICLHCCVNGVGQREECATEHKHLPGYSLCPTLSIVEGRDAPWRP